MNIQGSEKEIKELVTLLLGVLKSRFIGPDGTVLVDLKHRHLPEYGLDWWELSIKTKQLAVPRP